MVHTAIDQYCGAQAEFVVGWSRSWSSHFLSQLQLDHLDKQNRILVFLLTINLVESI